MRTAPPPNPKTRPASLPSITRTRPVWTLVVKRFWACVLRTVNAQPVRPFGTFNPGPLCAGGLAGHCRCDGGHGIDRRLLGFPL